MTTKPRPRKNFEYVTELHVASSRPLQKNVLKAWFQSSLGTGCDPKLREKAEDADQFIGAVRVGLVRNRG